MKNGAGIEVCAEIAYEADRRARRAQDKREVAGWHMLDPDEQARWVSWTEQVLQGSARLTTGQNFAAGVARLAAEHIGLELHVDGELGRVVSIVAKHYGLSIEDIASKSRLSEVVRARHVAMFFGAEMRLSLSALGRYFDRDHTAVRDGIRKLRAETAQSDHVRAEIEALRLLIFQPAETSSAA